MCIWCVIKHIWTVAKHLMCDRWQELEVGHRLFYAWFICNHFWTASFNCYVLYSNLEELEVGHWLFYAWFIDNRFWTAGFNCYVSWPMQENATRESDKAEIKSVFAKRIDDTKTESKLVHRLYICFCFVQYFRKQDSCSCQMLSWYLSKLFLSSKF